MIRSPTRKSQLVRSNVDRALFIDKLTERWLVERSAVTMYDLAIAALNGVPDLPVRLTRFREQEQLHADMLEQLLSEFGRNPRNEPATVGINLGASEMSA